MTESDEGRAVPQGEVHESTDAAGEWHAPVLTDLGDAIPLTQGAAGTTPDGSNLQS
jgi:hypothetical protein